MGDPERERRALFGDRTALVVVAVLMFAGLALRRHGLDAMLPHALEPDSDIVLQVELLEGGSGNALKLEKYPHFVAQLVRLRRALQSTYPLPVDADLAAHRRRASQPVLEVREAIALLSLLIVPATYAIARCWLGPGWSLVAAAFALSSLLMQSLGQQARPHAAVAATTALAVAACLWMRRRPGWASYIAAGAATGLALGSLQSGLVCVLALVAAHLFRARDRREHSRLLPFAAVGLVALALVGFYPFYFFSNDIPAVAVPSQPDSAGVELQAHPALPTQDVTVTSAAVRHGQHRVVWDNFDGSGLGLIVSHLGAYEPVLGALALIGLLFALVRARRWMRDRSRWADLMVLLGFAWTYFVVLALYRNTLARYLLPLLPYLACLAAVGLAGLVSLAPRARTPLAAVLTVAALAFPSYACWKLAAVRAAPDTIEQAAAWIERRLAPGKSVTHGLNLDLPLVPNEQALAANLAEERRFQVGPWMAYLGELETPPSLPRYPQFRMPASTPQQRKNLRQDLDAYVTSFETDYAVLLLQEAVRERGRGSRQEHRAHKRGPTELLSLHLRKHGNLIARFTAQGTLGKGGEAFDFEYAAGNHRASFLRQLFDATCMGPIVEVFALRSAPAGSEALEVAGQAAR